MPRFATTLVVSAVLSWRYCLRWSPGGAMPRFATTLVVSVPGTTCARGSRRGLWGFDLGQRSQYITYTLVADVNVMSNVTSPRVVRYTNHTPYTTRHHTPPHTTHGRDAVIVLREYPYARSAPDDLRYNARFGSRAGLRPHRDIVYVNLVM